MAIMCPLCEVGSAELVSVTGTRIEVECTNDRRFELSVPDLDFGLIELREEQRAAIRARVQKEHVLGIFVPNVSLMIPATAL